MDNTLYSKTNIVSWKEEKYIEAEQKQTFIINFKDLGLNQ